MDLKKYIPEIINFKNKKRVDKLETIWKRIYEERKQKTSSQRAKYAANIAVYSAIIQENFIISKKKKKKKKKNIINKEKYKKYELNNTNIIVTTDKNVLTDYKYIKAKGNIKNALFEYDQEILNKVINKYNLEIHPNVNTYYVILNKSEK